MSLPVLTALTDARYEDTLVRDLATHDRGVVVVRRCVDMPDLLSAAAAGAGRAVVVSADLRRLDGEALARLAFSGVAVVGVSHVAGSPAERRLRALGVTRLVQGDAAPAAVVQAVVEAIAAGIAPPAGYASAAVTSAPERDSDPPDESSDDASTEPGVLVAVWGPTGAPGRTTLAVSLAAETAARGLATSLVDADVYGGAVAPQLGFLDEAAGIAAACRLATTGGLTAEAIAATCQSAAPRLRVLSGLTRADRWPELRPAAYDIVLQALRVLDRVTVVDTGFCLEQDEELSWDGVVARRNGVTHATLASADVVVAVGSADPVGVARLIRGLAELAPLVRDDARVVVVVNKLRRGVLDGDPAAEVRDALRRHAGVAVDALVPWDGAAYDAATRAGKPLCEVAPRSAARLAVQALAADLVGVAAPSRRRLRRR